MVLMTALSNLTAKVSKWNKHVFGNIHLRKKGSWPEFKRVELEMIRGGAEN